MKTVSIISGCLLMALSAVPEADGAEQLPPCDWQTQLERGRDSLRLVIRVPQTKMPKGFKSMAVTPVYITQNGDSLFFPQMWCLSPTEAKYHRRDAVLDRRQENELTVMAKSNRIPATDYDFSILVPSSSSGEVSVTTAFYDCCKPVIADMKFLPVERGPETDLYYMDRPVHTRDTVYLATPPQVIHDTVYLTKPVYAERSETNRIQKALLPGADSIQFCVPYPQNIDRPESDLPEARRVLGEIDSFFDTLRRRQGEVTYVRIVGYASPEDTWRYNLDLSERRAGNMRRLLTNDYGVSASKIRTRRVGEDWEGLERLIKEERPEWSSAALDIIDRYSVFNGREKRLMDLHGGNPYRYMYRNYFPKLRRIMITIYYEIPDR